MVRQNYYQQNRKKLFQKMAIFLLAFFLVYILGGVLFRPLSGPVGLIFRPLWWGSEGLYAAGQGVFDFFHNRNRLVIENRDLVAENTQLKLALLNKDKIESDNRFLRSQFGLLKDKSLPIIGELIFLPNFIPYQTLLIDIGQNNSSKKIRVGDLAVTGRTVLVGRVAELGPWYSKVQLLSAENDVAVVIGPKNVPASAKGAGAGNFSVSLPKDTPIAIGDKVLAPLFDNFLIGTVRAISKNPSKPNQEILIKTPVNLWQLKWLEIYHAKT